MKALFATMLGCNAFMIGYLLRERKERKMPLAEQYMVWFAGFNIFCFEVEIWRLTYLKRTSLIVLSFLAVTYIYASRWYFSETRISNSGKSLQQK
jgi:hypothetical protein